MVRVISDMVREAMGMLFCSFRCALCGSASSFLLCPDCFERLFSIDMSVRHRCGRCGRPLVSEESVCMECRRETVQPYTDSVFPLFPYEGIRKDVFSEWKFEGRRDLTARFARAVAPVLTELYPSYPIIPVPPRPGKVRKVLWDQTADLCRVLRAEYRMPILPLLERRSGTQQKSLDREGRFRNMEQAFRLKRRCAGMLPVRAVLLDDVVTTGATLSSCGRVLREAGLAEVRAVSLFYVE